MSGDVEATLRRHVVVVADGDVDAARLAQLATAAELVIAADGGAAKALSAGVSPDVVIGDGDSLGADARARLHTLGIEIRSADPAKDESDTELCLLAAIEAGATRISTLGALGGRRPEHSVANLLLLADPRLDGIEVEIVGQGSRLTRIGTEHDAGSLRMDGKPGDFVSLFAIAGPVHGVHTSGLRFPLDGETLTVGPARGLSNEMVGPSAKVRCERGRLVIIHTIRIVEDADHRGGS